MAITSERLAVAATEVSLNTPNRGGVRLVVTNSGANVCDLGPSGVALGAGYELASGGGTVSVELDAREELFAISSGGATTVQVLRT